MWIAGKLVDGAVHREADELRPADKFVASTRFANGSTSFRSSLSVPILMADLESNRTYSAKKM